MIVTAMTDAGTRTRVVFDRHLLERAPTTVKRAPCMMDVKGDGVRKFAPRLELQDSGSSPSSKNTARSSAINLIETPRMAASTAAALYPVKHTKVPAFGMGARGSLRGPRRSARLLRRATSWSCFTALKDPGRLQQLAETNDRVRAAHLRREQEVR